jgi:hypothetical protein
MRRAGAMTGARRGSCTPASPTPSLHLTEGSPLVPGRPPVTLGAGSGNPRTARVPPPPNGGPKRPKNLRFPRAPDPLSQYCSARLLRHPTPIRGRGLGNLANQEFGYIYPNMGDLQKRRRFSSSYPPWKHQLCRTVLPLSPFLLAGGGGCQSRNTLDIYAFLAFRYFGPLAERGAAISIWRP